MRQEDLEHKSEREILIDLRIATAVLEERTEHLPEMKEQISRNVGDIGWLKKLLYAAIPGGTLIVALFRYVL